MIMLTNNINMPTMGMGNSGLYGASMPAMSPHAFSNNLTINNNTFMAYAPPQPSVTINNNNFMAYSSPMMQGPMASPMSFGYGSMPSFGNSLMINNNMSPMAYGPQSQSPLVINNYSAPPVTSSPGYSVNPAMLANLLDNLGSKLVSAAESYYGKDLGKGSAGKGSEKVGDWTLLNSPDQAFIRTGKPEGQYNVSFGWKDGNDLVLNHVWGDPHLKQARLSSDQLKEALGDKKLDDVGGLDAVYEYATDKKLLTKFGDFMNGAFVSPEGVKFNFKTVQFDKTKDASDGPTVTEGVNVTIDQPGLKYTLAVDGIDEKDQSKVSTKEYYGRKSVAFDKKDADGVHILDGSLTDDPDDTFSLLKIDGSVTAWDGKTLVDEKASDSYEASPTRGRGHYAAHSDYSSHYEKGSISANLQEVGSLLLSLGDMLKQSPASFGGSSGLPSFSSSQSMGFGNMPLQASAWSMPSFSGSSPFVSNSGFGMGSALNSGSMAFGRGFNPSFSNPMAFNRGMPQQQQPQFHPNDGNQDGRVTLREETDAALRGYDNTLARSSSVAQLLGVTI